MTKLLAKTLALAGIATVAATATTVAATPQPTGAAAAVRVDAAATASVKKLTRFRILRRGRFQLNRCRIVRERVQLPTGRWVIVERRQCPDTGTLAPRS